MAKRRFIKKGLVHGALRMEVQDVTGRHKTRCEGCDVDIPKGERRLLLRIGSGQNQKAEVYCDSCGVDVLEKHAAVILNAIPYLQMKTDRAIRDLGGDDES